jgi:hypothetical protein
MSLSVRSELELYIKKLDSLESALVPFDNVSTDLLTDMIRPKSRFAHLQFPLYKINKFLTIDFEKKLKEIEECRAHAKELLEGLL